MNQRLLVETITEHAFAEFGRVLSGPFPGKEPTSAFSFPKSDFWQATTFDPGSNGQSEVLWVNYRDTSLVLKSLEAHWLTEQAILPLQGTGLIHAVARSVEGQQHLPDLKTVKAFHIAVGQGICMKPGCWHASFSTGGVVQCLMLTRTSTTLDLVQHLSKGTSATETSIVGIEPLQLRQAT